MKQQLSLPSKPAILAPKPKLNDHQTRGIGDCLRHNLVSKSHSLAAPGMVPSLHSLALRQCRQSMASWSMVG